MTVNNSKKQVKGKNRQRRAKRSIEVSWQDVLGLSEQHSFFRPVKEKKNVLEKRMLRFEELEQRLVLSVDPLAFSAPSVPDIQFGSVYYEDPRGLGMDHYGDVFQVSWTGGIEGTQLKELRINLDKNQNGLLDPGECFFDLSGQNGGVYGHYPFTIIATEGVVVKGWSVDDGGQLLVIQFSEFQTDGKFVFAIDVDQYDVNYNGSNGTNALVEGAEFELSHLFCVFEHSDYETENAHLVFYDRFSNPKDVGLNLPDVGYDMNPPHEVLTAGAIGSFTQTPKKGSLSGYVYEDNNNNGIKDAGERGIGGVTLKLWVWDGTRYVDTGHVAITNQDGFYKFDDLDPFKTYRITEIQPNGYADGLDKEGSLGGTAINPGDEIIDISVGANQHGVNYNFGELKYGSLSGYVYEDDNCDGIYQKNDEVPIPGVTLELWVWDETSQKYVDTGLRKVTDVNGFYKFDNLDPLKKYRIIEKLTEEQKAKYFTGRQEVGSLGGITLTPSEKTITEIHVGIGQDGLGYNFANRLPGSISGYVYEDKNDNGIKEAGEPGIPGVEIELWYVSWANRDAFLASPNPALYEFLAKTTTDANGFYKFDHLDPCLMYAVREKQPNDYLDGKDTPGGGGKNGENDEITDIPLKPGKEDGNNNFGELRPSRISGYVFQDGNAVHLYPSDPNPTIAPPTWNGEFNAGVKPISGVVLILADSKGNPLRDADGNLIQVKSDANGYYEFTMLTEGVYSVIEVQPNGYLDGIDTPGSNGGWAINAYDTATVVMLKGQGVDVDSLNNDAIVGIVLGYADHAVMNNFSEVLVLRDLVPPPPPVVPPGDNPFPHFTPDLPRGIAGSFAPFGYTPYQYSPSYDLTSSERGGGGIPEPNYTWHLSVVNGGFPRGEGQGESQVASTNATTSATFRNVSWHPLSMKKGKWIVRDKNGNPLLLSHFGIEGGRPVVGDFNGDGFSQLAMYHDGVWYIDLNGNGEWDEGDLIAELGGPSDQPIVGDWDGDGKADIGIFGPEWQGDRNAIPRDPGLPSDLNTLKIPGGRPKNMPPTVNEATIGHRRLQRTAQGSVRADLIDHVFEYGGKGDFAFTGDFTGDGITTIGVYRNGSFYIDRDGDGRWDPKIDIYIPNVGRPGEIPVIGDFNGDGIDEIGLYKDGYWRLNTTGDFTFDTEIRFGEVGDLPIVGDFTGDGYAQIGVYRPNDNGTGLYTQDDLRRETPQPMYGQQYNPNGSGSIPSESIPSETIRGHLPEDSSNRPGRTQRTVIE